MQLASKLQLSLGNLNNLLKEAVADFLLNLGDSVTRISILQHLHIGSIGILVSLKGGFALPLHLLDVVVSIFGSLGALFEQLVEFGLFLRGAD